MKSRLLVMLTAGLILAAGAPGRGVAKDEAEKPVSVKESLERFNTALGKKAPADVPFDLTLNDSLPFLRFKEMPFRIAVQDPKVVDYQVMGGKAVTLGPQGVGRTHMRLIFGDKTNAATQWVVTLRVNVKEAPKDDPEKPIPIKESLDRLGKALAKREDAEIPVFLAPEQSLPLPLKELPFQVQLLDATRVDYGVGKPPPPSLTLQAKRAGRAPVALWFGDRTDSAKQFVITLKVRVRENQK